MVELHRTPQATTVICADGVGKGIRATVAASAVVARFRELLKCGFSLRRAFTSVARTMNASKGTDLPYVAFSVARILSDGQATILAFEAPAPILVSRGNAAILTLRTLVFDDLVAEETNCLLEPGEGIMLMTDGVTQAGMGAVIRGGWRSEGACAFINDQLSRGIRMIDIPEKLRSRAVQLSEGTSGDDVTAVLAHCRPGRVVTLLTGPPSEAKRDREVVQHFLNQEGIKIVCGATSADIVAKFLGTEVSVDRTSLNMIAPPRYVLKGVDVVTEGTVTLNQLYNVLDESPDAFEEDSGVTELYSMLQAADRVNFMLGGALNPANKHISFRQQGILPRGRIIQRIAEKLTEMGKLVVIEHV